MESQDEFTEFNDQSTLIIKGKRTKRGRPCSPSGVAAAETSSSSAGGYFSVLSPMSSGEISTTTDEDEDMANCLILLARGVNSIPNRPETEAQKFTSRRLAGFDDYECKTCNRRFPSFQALGGHRASHRKPKGLPLIQKPSHEDDEPVAAKFAKVSHSPSPFQTAINKPKVHECSICGSEFSSGQALGGHMRRHRALPQTTDAKNILSLDLNLPAPLEDDNHGDEGSNFHYLPPSTAEHMVFSAAALVDCHY